MRIATWNLNNRVGRVRFRPEAAQASMALDVDLLVLTEFYPKHNEVEFRATLAQGGWEHQLMSQDTGAVANRVLIASRLPLEPMKINLPQFDAQFPSNLAACLVPSTGLSLIGIRIPAYSADQRPLLKLSWDWLEATAEKLADRPAVIIGDLNVGLASRASVGGEHFRRICEGGWRRAQPAGQFSFYGRSDRCSEIDHLLATSHCECREAAYVLDAGGFRLAAADDALSDHAALVGQVVLARD